MSQATIRSMPAPTQAPAAQTHLSRHKKGMQLGQALRQGLAQTASLGDVNALSSHVKRRNSLTVDRGNHRPPALLNRCEGVLQLSDVPAESLALPPRAGSAGPLCKHGRNVGQINARTKVIALAAHDHLQPRLGCRSHGELKRCPARLLPHCLNIFGSIQGLQCLQ